MDYIHWISIAVVLLSVGLALATLTSLALQ